MQYIGVQNFIARSTGPPLPQLLFKTLGVGNILSSVRTLFLGFHGHPLLERSKNCCLKKLASAPPACGGSFFTPAIIEDLLNPFCMFDTKGYDSGLSPGISEYQSVVWTNQKRSIPFG
jgi:hypothetical protein